MQFCNVGINSFNTQPPEGGWPTSCTYGAPWSVSTHSRPKAAGNFHFYNSLLLFVSTHSRPKAAGLRRRRYSYGTGVSTHSRPKAAGR